MKKPNKKQKVCLQTIDQNKTYSLEEAVTLLKNMPHAKFDETVEISSCLNIDFKKTELLVRAATVLPHGIGKTVRVCAFCKGEDVSKAKEAGADFAGGAELIDKINKGWLEFDKTASTLEMMKDVAQLGKVLGPRGMMPSPKVGTVGPDIAAMVKDLKGGKIQFKTDKTGNIHAVCGKISFTLQQLCENVSVLIKAILAVRPSTVKGRFLKSLTISTTMSPGIKLDTGKLS